MDEYNSGMDPELKKYFRIIIKSFSAGLLWLIVVSTAGIFFKLAIITGRVYWYNILFYVLFLASFYVLARYYYKIWNKKHD